MVIAETIAGAAAGAHAIWDYNRENFLYDRRMRQETELKILEWRAEQSELWRDDIRELIGLTEKKMDSYLVVSTLQLGMCLGLFTEGRLEPGTPPWLIHFYALTLAAAFMYLLMSVWLSVHASIVAQCSSVRLLTQFVRLPIPRWEDLQNMRTFASSYEHVETKHMMRIPFTRNPKDKKDEEDPRPLMDVSGGASSSSRSVPRSTQSKREIDPWTLENHGEDRNLYELEHIPAAQRRHVCLARRAGKQYQCFDAFSRVSMAFGTNQLLHAICYYALGYVAVQDGAPWPAFCVIGLMCAMGVALVQLDITMSDKERLLANLLIVTGPLCTAVATFAWSTHGDDAEPLIMILLPCAYAAHGLWLFFALISLGLEVQPNGAILPQKFRAVLYMDVFGMLQSKTKRAQGAEEATFSRAPYSSRSSAGQGTARSVVSASGEPQDADRIAALKKLKKELKADIKLWQSANVQRVMEEADRERADELMARAQEAMAEDGESSPALSRLSTRQSADEEQFVKLQGYTDFGGEVPYLYNPKSGEARMLDAAEEDEEEMDAAARSSNDISGVRTMTAFDEKIDKYCVHKKASKKAANAAARRLPPEAMRRSENSGILDAARSAVTPVVKAIMPEHEEDDEESAEEDPTQYPAMRHAESMDLGAPSPSGELGGSTARFDAASYTPHPDLGLESRLGDKEEVVSGHDKMDPGRLPAKVFRMATMLMVFLWAVGLMLPFGVFREFMTTPLMVEEEVEGAEGGEEKEIAVMGTAPDGLPELIPEIVVEDFPTLPEGDLIAVDWPYHSGFVPRSLSSDPSGTRLVVANDIGVYVGQIREIEDPAFEVGLSAKQALASERRLRGGQKQSLRSVGFAKFHRVPPCNALEGQAIQDISVACEPEDLSRCRVVVLHAKGHHLAECPLGDLNDDSEGYRARMAALPMTEPLEWKIAENWLHRSAGRKKEYVQALATNSDCVDTDSGEMGAFRAESVGCVVVGTSEGRLVQLRGAYADPQRLVPERAMEQRKEGISRGSLHVLPNGFVLVLRHESNTLQAFDSARGVSAGEWRLPDTADWLTVGGGGGSLYLLGFVNGTHLQLHKIPVPEKLQRKKGSIPDEAESSSWIESPQMEGPSLAGDLR
eukprot:gb/GFBE01035287.1/.p1 GENE.gb/GFBE01035287.1/~~gb/GFBE01035287.1/.p1  ORF type:complete len:1123 (+),score=215.77 gb/GFBE01035287.1/:1-3369(+)